MRVLILIDKFNWSYHSIAKALVKYNDRKNLDISIMPIKKNISTIKKEYKKFDLFFVMGWQTWDLVKFLPIHSTLTGVHSFHSWDEQKSMPMDFASPSDRVVDLLSKFNRVNAVSDTLCSVFKKAGLNNIYTTPNGVDSNLFKPHAHSLSRLKEDFIVGYSGSSSHDWRKGVSEFILPAAKKAGVRTHLAQLSKKTHVDLEDMPSFYKNIDAYICASSSEGYSLSVLEAASCGKVIISTRVSGCIDLIDDTNGFLVDRDVDSIVEKIKYISNNPLAFEGISKKIREDIVSKHCWSKKVDAWLNFIEGSI